MTQTEQYEQLLALLNRQDRPATLTSFNDEGVRSIHIVGPTAQEINQALIFAGDAWNAQGSLWCGLTGWWNSIDIGWISFLKPKWAMMFNLTEQGIIHVAEERDIRLVPPEPDSPCHWAAEIIPAHQRFTIPIRDYSILGTGSPLGYQPTRMRPGDDSVDCRSRAQHSQHSTESPHGYILDHLISTQPYGWLFDRPSSSVSIDRVWYWLARRNNLEAERDIEAYALGWWRIDRNRGWQCFKEPQRIWGFHHPHVYSLTQGRDEIDVPLYKVNQTTCWRVVYINLTAGQHWSQIPHVTDAECAVRPKNKLGNIV